MKLKNLICSFFILFCFCSCSKKITSVVQTDEHNFTCQYEGRRRSFLLYMPEEITRENKLIVLLHGSGESTATFQTRIRFEEDALKRGYSVLYLQGETNPDDKTSPAGWVNTYTKYGKEDLNFIIDAADYVKSAYKINKAYLGGFSNGGFMTFKVSIEKPEAFCAFASVAGMMPGYVWDKRKNKKASFFQVNGLKDDVVPMKLTKTHTYSPNPAMEDVMEYFAATNHLKTGFIQQQINKDVCIRKAENKVWWMTIQDYHHSWPKNDRSNINVNEFILDFFDAS